MNAAVSSDLLWGCALVTGSGRGIGRATALALAEIGLPVALVARTRHEVESVRGLVLAAGGRAAAYAADLTLLEACGPLIDRISAEFAPPSVLVNNAGIAPSAPLAKTTDVLWDQTIELDLVVPFVLSRLVAPRMVAAGAGRIIHVASTASLKGYAYTSAYTAAKHGLLGLARAQSRDWAPRGVTVNCVCPGFVDTAISASAAQAIAAKTGRSLAEAASALVAENPLGRLVEPREVAAAILGFIAPGTAALTGQATAVAGGAVEG